MFSVLGLLVESSYTERKQHQYYCGFNAASILYNVMDCIPQVRQNGRQATKAVKKKLNVLGRDLNLRSHAHVYNYQDHNYVDAQCT